MSPVTPDQLRRALRYPDDVPGPGIELLLARGRRARRRQQVARTGAVAALAAAVAGPFVLADGGGRTVTENPAGGPSAVPTAPPPTNAPNGKTATPTPATPAKPRLVRAGERVDLGNGWAVWSKGTDICTREPNDSGVPASVPPNVDCRSTTDGNIGGIGFTGQSSRTERINRSVFPGVAQRVVVTFEDGVPREARVLWFEERPGWSYYFLSARGSFPYVHPAHDRKTVVAYDADGRVVSRFP